MTANKSDPNYNEKIRIIDALIDYYPDLKKDRNVLNNIFFDKSDKPNKFILEKVDHNKNVYYKSNDGLLIDGNIKCSGIYKDGKILIIRPNSRKDDYNTFIEEFKNYKQEKFMK